MARLNFVFPVRPSWNQTADVFVTEQFTGEAAESDELIPRWFGTDALPFDGMWDDARYWVPRVLAASESSPTSRSPTTARPSRRPTLTCSALQAVERHIFSRAKVLAVTSAATSQPSRPQATGTVDSKYKWVALSNTTLSITMATIDTSIVIIAMPAIFRGIHLDPTAPGNISYLLWMIIGYLLVTAVLVVTLGRLGDMFGRVRIYNLGFVVFTLASIALSLDPLTGPAGAMWLILWRLGQAFGGAMLMANAAAILTDAFPARQRGMALGINQICGISGQFIGLMLGGVLAAWDWRAVFWVNVPIGVFGTIWSYRKLREIATVRRATIDWWGNITFAVGAGLLLVAITYGIQPYGGHPTGWTSPRVLGGLAGGVVLLVAFCLIETKIAEPMFQLGLFRIRAFAAGNLASLMGSIARGGLQFMLIIWLQGIWLPERGYNFAQTPLLAGIYLLPLTAGFLDRRPDLRLPV